MHGTPVDSCTRAACNSGRYFWQVVCVKATYPPGTALCRGSLPPSWQQFGGLQLLWLHHNQLTGSLPLGLGVGSSLPRLTHLDVSYNQLTGRLPPGLGSGDGNACTVPPMPSALQYL